MSAPKATAPPYVSGYCNPTLPRTDAYDPHTRCPGCTCMAPGCPCRTVALSQDAAATVEVLSQPAAAAPWTWEADAAADVMLEPGNCPMCGRDWIDAHQFLDDGRVACA